MKSSKVSIKTRSPPASRSFKGQATKHTTVKWSIPRLKMIASGRKLTKVVELSRIQAAGTVHIHKRVYMGIQGYTGVHKGIHGFTRVYMRLQGYTRVDMGIQGYRRVHTGINGYTRVHMGIQRYTKVYKGMQGYTRVYMGIQGYT